ncbi:hypothetical protein CCO03_16940 [Comamonas serinivorans]|uniref:Uncharacterized protein n=1 Tax=Comamonas serinivorans TaxID=1082851 RepID=A0A1Y0ESA7_9BURK|nr:hypothetical protein [Comamonas serinivorans]ARU06132.1 hypothetical protein CCO03_16940 [Comamonas serinivorans]
MTALFIFLVALHVAPTLFLLMLHLISDRSTAIADAIRALDIGALDKSCAVACMERARAAERKTYWVACLAPIVTFYALLFTPKSANKLPAWARKWDNNVSLNGDAYAVLRDGQWVTLRNGEKAQPGEVPVSYDDPAYTGDAYYAKGHHPTSFWARWMWVGWRNRASGLSLSLGPELTEPLRVVAGDVTASRDKPGFFLTCSGDEYQWRSYTKKGPVVLITNFGAKLDYQKWLPDGQGQVPYVAIGISFKGAR